MQTNIVHYTRFKFSIAISVILTFTALCTSINKIYESLPIVVLKVVNLTNNENYISLLVIDLVCFCVCSSLQDKKLKCILFLETHMYVII